MSQSMIDKIRGLLAKAESTEFEEEADLFLQKATELMAKYRIDEALLQAANKSADDPVERITITVGKWGIAKGSLIVYICKSFGCHAVWAAKVGGQRRCNIIGHKSDLEMVTALFTSLEIQLDRELLNVQGYDKGETRSARSSFANGWCSKVGTRVKSHYKKAMEEEKSNLSSSEESSSVALVLASRDDAVEAKYQEIYNRKPRYKSSTTRTSDYVAYQSGYAAGNNADIGASAIGSQRAIH